MPKTLEFQAPSPHVCPICDEALTGLPCPGCGAQLTHPEAAALLDIDRELHRLATERDVIVQRLLASPGSSPSVPPPPPLAGATRERRSAGWSVAEMLVGLGGLSLVAAVAVFAAVSWSDLAAWVQGSLLLVTTAVVVAVARTLLRRGLTATAESLGVVSVAFALADIEVVRTGLAGAVSTRSVWTLGLAAVAAGAVVVGRSLGLRGMTAAGVTTAFAPAVVALAGDHALSVLAGALVVQSALAFAISAWVRRRTPVMPDARVLAPTLDAGGLASAVAAGTLAVAIGTQDRWSGPSSVSIVAVGLLLSLAAVAVGAAVLAGWRRTTNGVALAAGAVAVLVAAALATPPADDGLVTTVVLLTAAVSALLCAALVQLDPRRPWAVPMTTVAAAAAALALVPLSAAAGTLLALADVVSLDRDIALATDLAVELERSTSIVSTSLPTASVIPQLAALGLVGVAALFAGRRWGSVFVIGTALAALVVAPVVAGASVGVTALLYGAVWCALAARQRTVPESGAGSLGIACAGGLFSAVALATPGSTIAATSVVVAGLGVIAHAALQHRASSASLWVAATVAVGLGGVAIAAERIGSEGSIPAVAVAVAAALASVLGPLIERGWSDERSGAAAAGEIVAGTGLVVAALASRSIDAASVVVVVIALVAGLHALRPTRGPLVGVALGATVVLVWLRLTVADVVLLEAYTLPLAGALLVGGALVRPASRSSWVRNGPGLVAALVPSTVLALADGSAARTVVVVLAAGGAAVWGAGAREQAPLAVGGAVLSTVALRHLGPVADELPRYVVFGVVGVGLLATGATFERRRRDLRRARDAFSRLG